MKWASVPHRGTRETLACIRSWANRKTEGQKERHGWMDDDFGGAETLHIGYLPVPIELDQSDSSDGKRDQNLTRCLLQIASCTKSGYQV